MAGFNLRSYKGLAGQANLILSRIKKAGLSKNSAVEKLKNNLTNFWEKRGKTPPTKSGISFNKRMNAEDKREMAQILRSFINEPRKTPEEIRADYEEKIGQYIEGLSPKNQEKLKNKSVQEMYKDIERIDRILKSRKTIESLGSQVVNRIKTLASYMGLNEKTVFEALFNVMETGDFDNYDNTDESFNRLFDAILTEYDRIVNSEGL